MSAAATCERPMMHRSLATNLLVQGLGSFAPMLTIILLARVGGETAQGVFSSFKAWTDLIVALAVFGFPQSFVYLINKRISTAHDLLNFSLIYAAAATVVTGMIVVAGTLAGYDALPIATNLWVFGLFVAIGSGAVVLHRLVRAIYLTIDDGLLFSLITCAPSVFLMVATVGAAMLSAFRFDLAWLVAGIATLAATTVWISGIAAAAGGHRLEWPVLEHRTLMTQSAHAFLQSLAFTLQPVAAINIMLAFGASLGAVAFFTASTIIVNGANVVFAIVSPVLFNRWTADYSDAVFANVMRVAILLGVVFGLGSGVAWWLLPWLVPVVFGDTYVAAIGAFQIVALSMAPIAFTRTISPVTHAAGRPDVNTISCAVRLSVAVVIQGLLAYRGGTDPLLGAPVSLAAAEWIAAGYSWWMGRKLIACGKAGT
jgi:O-antigen/teichoic acid export membrane protein